MRKLKIFSFLVAFFLGGIIFSFKSHAEAMPSLSEDTIHMILDGNESLTYSSFSSFNILPINVNPTLYYNMFAEMQNDPLITGARLNTISSNDYTVTKLTQTQIDTFSQSIPYLYDVNGNTVNWNDVYYCTYINGMFHGDLYVDSNGNILTLDINKTKTAFKLGLGGYLLNISDIANIYNDISDLIPNQEFNYALNQVDLSNADISLYYMVGARAWDRTELNVIYVPNVYAEGFCVSPEDPATFYWNDGYSPVIYAERGKILANSWTPVTFRNITYDHGYNFGNYFRNGERVSYSTFLTLSNNRDCLINFNGFTFDSTLWSNGDNIISFKKLDPLPSTKQLQFSDDYDYNHIKELEQSLENTTSTPDTNFDPSQGIDELNYPLIFEVPESTPDSEPSELPFPSNNPNPNPNPDPNTDPNLDYSQITQPTNEDVELSFDNFQIPFVSGLFNRYPFCIPWDIKNFINSLKAEPQAPAWDFDYSITVANHTYTTHFEGDLSDYNSLATIFRNLLLIGFIIGLCKFSYDHHF